MSVSDLNTYLITHCHADHIGGLEEVMMFGRYLTKKKPSILINEDLEKILWNMSLKGCAAFNESKNGSDLIFTDLWNPIRPRRMANMPRETWVTELGNLNIKLFRTKHIPDHYFVRKST